MFVQSKKQKKSLHAIHKTRLDKTTVSEEREKIKGRDTNILQDVNP